MPNTLGTPEGRGILIAGPRTLVVVVAALLVGRPGYASASAGGFSGGPSAVGGSGGAAAHGNGVVGLPPVELWLVVVALLALWWLATTGVFLLKGAHARLQLAHLSDAGADWDAQQIEWRAMKVFYAVQKAWAARDMARAYDLVSERFANEHSPRLDRMRERLHVNKMEDLKLKGAVVVGLSVGASPEDDRLCVWMEGSLVDYVVEEKTGIVVDGNANGPRRLRELWYLVRGADGWVVDTIDQHAFPWKVLAQRCSVDRGRVPNNGIERTPSALD